MDFQSFSNFNFENYPEVYDVDTLFMETFNDNVLETTNTQSQIESRKNVTQGSGFLFPNGGLFTENTTYNSIKTEKFEGFGLSQLNKIKKTSEPKGGDSIKQCEVEKTKETGKTEETKDTKKTEKTEKTEKKEKKEAKQKTKAKTKTKTKTKAKKKTKTKTKRKTKKKTKKRTRSAKETKKKQLQDLDPEILALRPTRKRTQLCTLDIEMTEYEKKQLRQLSKEELANLTKKERLERKRIRDRISARNSRQKQKKYLSRLETRAQEILDEKNKVEEKLNELEFENVKLKEEIQRLKNIVLSTNFGQTNISRSTKLENNCVVGNIPQIGEHKKRRLLPHQNQQQIGIEY
ncbi:basic-leucine zipper transcription factor f-related [Anaeramoeba flamelloides]|uniref:Basic-leucine zipper transcription factor f-related n=1 Tax=Anaeramoeba flamelloides TaxID=1746091 RepID=A0AAV8A5K6_9EUKA|nr:basic-leucine zipper transcription factor f-related [Anaeramoeba flamelloides]